MAYALAGADCVDVAADPAVIMAARQALQSATALAKTFPAAWPHYQAQPWLMVSLNDGEDPHFRKAAFDATHCPTDCLRPCESICPAQAITFQSGQSGGFSGVVEDLCYGCGRCLPVCPIQHISTRSYVSAPDVVAPLVLADVDAVEIHTQVGRLEDFRRLWGAIAPWVPQLKLIAVSCPDHPDLIDYLRSLYQVMTPIPQTLVWQTDGRPMSGDIGHGTTHAAIRLGAKVLAANLPGYVQLAGGTNRYTVDKLRLLGLSPPCSGARQIAGVAYGSYARSQLADVIHQLEAIPLEASLRPKFTSTGGEEDPTSSQRAAVQSAAQLKLLHRAVDLARSLVAQLKEPSLPRYEQSADSVERIGT